MVRKNKGVEIRVLDFCFRGGVDYRFLFFFSLDFRGSILILGFRVCLGF